MRKCEAKDYDLEYKSLVIDQELVPGKASKMTTEFLVKKDVNFDKMIIRCYLKGLKVWQHENIKPADLKPNQTWFHEFGLTLPRVVPHVSLDRRSQWGGWFFRGCHIPRSRRD